MSAATPLQAWLNGRRARRRDRWTAISIDPRAKRRLDSLHCLQWVLVAEAYPGHSCLSARLWDRTSLLVGRWRVSHSGGLAVLRCAAPAHSLHFATEETISMNTEQLVTRIPSATSDLESSEPGSPAAPLWGETLAGVHTSAAGAVASPEEVLANWAAEDGQGQHGYRQQAVSRTSAWRGTGDLNQPLDLSSRSLTALPAPILAEVRRLNVDHNQLDSLPETLSTGLQRL